MGRRHEKAPPRQHRDEDEALDTGELCIRFMEQTLEGVMADEKLKDHYFDIFAILAEVSQDILKPYAYDFAYQLFSDEHIIRSRRLKFELEANAEAPDGAKINP